MACSALTTRALERGEGITQSEEDLRQWATPRAASRWNQLVRSTLYPPDLPLLEPQPEHLEVGVPAVVEGRIQWMSPKQFGLGVTRIVGQSAADLSTVRFATLTVDRTPAFEGLEAGRSLQTLMDTPGGPLLKAKVALKRSAVHGGLVREAILVSLEASASGA